MYIVNKKNIFVARECLTETPPQHKKVEPLGSSTSWCEVLEGDGTSLFECEKVGENEIVRSFKLQKR